MAKPKSPTWKKLLGRKDPLLLPAAHDALTAKLIERAGFKAGSRDPVVAHAMDEVASRRRWAD